MKAKKGICRQTKVENLSPADLLGKKCWSKFTRFREMGPAQSAGGREVCQRRVLTLTLRAKTSHTYHHGLTWLFQDKHKAKCPWPVAITENPYVAGALLATTDQRNCRASAGTKASARQTGWSTGKGRTGRQQSCLTFSTSQNTSTLVVLACTLQTRVSLFRRLLTWQPPGPLEFRAFRAHV